MLEKPSSCRTCPLYGDGKGYVPDEIVPNSEVFIMMQNPGGDEEFGIEADSGRVYKPAVGKVGQYMDNTFIPLAGITRGKNVSVGNVIKCRWINPQKGVKTNDLPSAVGVWNGRKRRYDQSLGAEIEREAAEHCLKTLTHIPDSTRLIVAQGDLAWRHVGGRTDGILGWRGFLSQGKEPHSVHKFRGLPVFGVLHLSYLLQTPRLSIPSMMDWRRIRAVLDGEWPRPVPNRRIASTLTPKAPDGTHYVTMDTEFDPNTYQIWLLGIAYWGRGDKPLGGEQVLKSCWRYDEVRTRVLEIVQQYPVICHNISAELMSIDRTFNITPDKWLMLEDTMQLHSLYQSEWQHDLGFIESMHGRHHRMKHLSDTEPVLYNWGDCLTCGYAFKDFRKQAATDPLSFRVYREQNIPLVPVRHYAKKAGLCIDTEFVSSKSHELAERIVEATRVAQSSTGFPLNMSSNTQIIAWLKDVYDLKLKRKRGSSTYVVDKDAIALLRTKFIEVDTDLEAHGITLDILADNIARGGHPLLEARAMYQSAQQFYRHFIVKLLKKKRRSTDAVRGYSADEFVDWISPDQHTHAQASGRWSVVDPALPTLPKELRPMILPLPGYAIVKYDADQQELRLNAHLSHDEPTLEAFANGYDIHTLNACDIFGIPYPPNLKDPHTSPECAEWRSTYAWEGKDDKRRVFSKRFVYRLIYRGNPKYANDIPGAKALGLHGEGLVTASNNYLGRHPNLRKHWAKMDAQVRSTRTVRSFRGRRRYLNGTLECKRGEVPVICREGTNHPMQSGGVDWNNLTILAIHRASRHMGTIWGYGAHDSHNWLVPVGEVDAFRELVMDITSEPWEIDGRPLVLPITMDDTIYRKEDKLCTK